MVSANLIKVVAAFVSGLVVALGSALIYVRVTDQRHASPQPVQTAIAAPAPVKQLPQAETEEAAPAPDTREPEPVVESVKVPPPPVVVRRQHATLKAIVRPSARKPVVLAQSQPAHVYVPPADTVNPPLPAAQEPEQKNLRSRSG
jgi:type IV secretory pathway VirB10-like protein